MPRPQSDLTKYILSLPAALATKEVIAKAKEKGFVTTEKNVHRVRAAKRKSAGKPAAAANKPAAASPKKAAAKPGRKPKGGKGGNKSAFVRGLAASMPAKEVVAAAKAAGISLNDKYVYNIRAAHRAKKKSGPKSAPAATARAVASPIVRRAAAKGGAEHTFVSAALDMGLTRASELLALLRDKVRSLTV